MTEVSQNNNKVTLWQGFSSFNGEIDTIVIYEPSHLKVVVKLNPASKDMISVDFNPQEIVFVTKETGIVDTFTRDRSSCWSEECVRNLWIPFPTNPKLARWEENDSVLFVTIPWAL